MLALVVVAALASSAIPPPWGLEAKVVADAADGRLDDVDLLTAALVASGVPDAKVPAERDRARAALAPAIARAKAAKGDRARGRALLAALHETVLARYRSGASEVHDVVAAGEFNCLSSAVLFAVAAEGLLQKPRAMITRHHAFARVDVDGRPADVETTSKRGFDVDRLKVVTPAYLRELGLDRGVRVDELAADLKNPEELPVTAFIAGLYSNRAVGLAEQGRHDDAAIAFDRAARTAKGAMRARVATWRAGLVNNAAIKLIEKDALDDAAALLLLGLDGVDGDARKVLTANLGGVRVRQGDRHAERKEHALAIAAYDEAVRLGVPARDVAGARRRALGELAASKGDLDQCGAAQTKETGRCLAEASFALLEKGRAPAALAAARRALALAPDDVQAKQAVFFALMKRIDADVAARACAAVESAAREAEPLKKAAQNEKWSGDVAVGACWANHAQDLHAQGELEDASAAFARALARMPTETQLRTALARTDAQRGQKLAEARRCDEARPLLVRAVRLEEALRPAARSTLVRCANLRAEDLAKKERWAEATIELRRGLVDAPDDEVLLSNLGSMLHNAAADALKAQQCDDARALLPDLDRYGKGDAAKAVRARCP